MQNNPQVRRIASSIREHMEVSRQIASGMGGTARFYVEVQTLSELQRIVNDAGEQKMHYLILGSGYSVLLPDKEFHGIVIKNSCRKFNIIGRRGKFVNGRLAVEKAMLFVESGAVVNQVVRFVISEGYSGMEQSLGLPGTIGGALMTENRQADPRIRLSSSLFSVRLLDGKGNLLELSAADFLGKLERREEMVILSAIFTLLPGSPVELWQTGSEALREREKKYPRETLLAEVFSPLDLSDALRVPTPLRTQEAHVLVEKAGLLGKQVGGVSVFEAYGNTLVCLGEVKKSDVSALIWEIQETVYRRLGVRLALRLKHFTL